MAAIVLVHGIDNQRETADGIAAAWLPDLAGGVRLAGRGDLADRLLAPRTQADAIEVRVAYYGELFRSPDLRRTTDIADDPFPEEEARMMALSLEWITRLADRAPAGSADAVQARMALDIAIDPEGAQAQGRGNVLRGVINTLARCSWLAKVGMTVAERFVVSALTQVSRYLDSATSRDRIRQSVLDLVNDDTRAIVGHSLGSVVAYECAHLLERPLPLLVTLGSPLGLRTIVADRVTPTPSFPPMVSSWLNIANREDYIAAEPDLRTRFARDVPAGSTFDGIRFDEICKAPHDARTYLGREPVGRAIIRALE